jgi:hypothetical protein
VVVVLAFSVVSASWENPLRIGNSTRFRNW